MNNSQPANPPVPADIDKGQQSGLWRNRKKWQDELYKSVCHQALDVPEDDMEINTGMKSEDVVRMVEAMMEQKGQSTSAATATATAPSPTAPAPASTKPEPAWKTWAKRAAIASLVPAGAAGYALWESRGGEPEPEPGPAPVSMAQPAPEWYMQPGFNVHPPEGEQ